MKIFSIIACVFLFSIKEMASVNDEILALSERETSNVKFKDTLSLAIFSFIKFVNDRIKDEQLKLVVCGGAAFNYYIKRTARTTKYISTHDFDLRLILDIPYSKNPLFKKATADKTAKWMKTVCSDVAKSFSVFLNSYIRRHGSRFTLETDFYAVERKFLSTVQYRIKGGEVDSLVDIVPHTNFFSYYGKLDVDKSELLEQYRQFDYFDVASRQGFFRSSLVYNKDVFGTYYASLGYLVWDTVRMLNYIVDSDKTDKFERYLYKYKTLLMTLSSPQTFLTCTSGRKYIQVCNGEQQVCKVDGKRIKSKKTLVDVAVRKGIIPPNWKKRVLKMAFEDVCKAMI